jgi:hypothetical protein
MEFGKGKESVHTALLDLATRMLGLEVYNARSSGGCDCGASMMLRTVQALIVVRPFVCDDENRPQRHTSCGGI